MERPNKEDYDFNNVFESVRFASNMIKYADYLETKQLTMPVVSNSYTKTDVIKAYDDGFNDGNQRK